MRQERVIEIFQDNGALLDGHFRLSSGVHSPRYLQCALVLQYSALAEQLCLELARQVQMHPIVGKIDVVVAPALGGIVLAHEVARALGLRAMFVEREKTTMLLRRGFAVKPGERCLVVEDVVTTGGSIREVMRVVEDAGGSTVAIGTIINRSPFFSFDVPSFFLAKLYVPVYEPENCPMCVSGVPLLKPGSRV